MDKTTLEKGLRAKARRLGLVIHSDRRGGFALIDPYTNAVAAPYPMALEQVALWLDDLEKQQGDEIPNADTRAAFAELDNGGGHAFTGGTNQLFSELMED